MNETHDVISAFLDDEPFEATKLVEALSDPEGRALLVDMIALRHLTTNGHEAAPVIMAHTPRRFDIRPLLAAAAVLVALVGGYVIGERQREVTPSQPPAPTRVVQATTTWQDIPERSMQ